MTAKNYDFPSALVSNNMWVIFQILFFIQPWPLFMAIFSLCFLYWARKTVSNKINVLCLGEHKKPNTVPTNISTNLLKCLRWHVYMCVNGKQKWHETKKEYILKRWKFTKLPKNTKKRRKYIVQHTYLYTIIFTQ